MLISKFLISFPTLYGLQDKKDYAVTVITYINNFSCYK